MSRSRALWWFTTKRLFSVNEHENSDEQKENENMAFLQKIEPYVVSGDPIVQQFVLQALEEYPHVPNEWTERLIEKAVRSHGKHREI